MPAAKAQSLREEALARLAEGASVRTVARELKIGKSTVADWAKQRIAAVQMDEPGALTAVDPLIAAGLVVKAEDTGRVLMLQRSFDNPEDPAAGTWEWPGGHIEGDADPFTAAKREWEEELGVGLPAGQTVGSWVAPNGIWEGFVYTIPSEDAIDLSNRDDKADPDGDYFEAAAWWAAADVPGLPALRPECQTSDWQMILRASEEARFGDLAGHDFHGNQHTGGLGAGKTVKVRLPVNSVQELRATQESAFGMGDGSDPYVGSIKLPEEGWSAGKQVEVEIRHDQIPAIVSAMRSDYDKSTGLGRDEQGKADPQSAAARMAPAMRSLADRLEKLHQANLGENSQAFGDTVGHDFHGNQYTSGRGGSQIEPSGRSKRLSQAHIKEHQRLAAAKGKPGYKILVRDHLIDHHKVSPIFVGDTRGSKTVAAWDAHHASKHMGRMGENSQDVADPTAAVIVSPEDIVRAPEMQHAGERPEPHVHDPDDPEPVLVFDLHGTLTKTNGFPLIHPVFPGVKAYMDRMVARGCCIHIATAGLDELDEMVNDSRMAMIWTWCQMNALPVSHIGAKQNSDVYYDDRMVEVDAENPDWAAYAVEGEERMLEKFDLDPDSGKYVRKPSDKEGEEIKEFPTEGPPDRPRGFTSHVFEGDVHRCISYASGSQRIAPLKPGALEVLTALYNAGYTIQVGCAGWNPATHEESVWRGRYNAQGQYLYEQGIPFDRRVSKDHGDLFHDDKGLRHRDWIADFPRILEKLHKPKAAHNIPMLMGEASRVRDSVFVSFVPSPLAASRLALDLNNPRVVAPEDLHLTLAYLGKADQVGDTEFLRSVVSSFASVAPVIQGQVNGQGRFNNGEAITSYWSVDSPGLQEFRSRLVEALERGGYPVDRSHGFTPHITTGHDVDMPLATPVVDLEFGDLWLFVGSMRFCFPLANRWLRYAEKTDQAASLQPKPKRNQTAEDEDKLRTSRNTDDAGDWERQGATRSENDASTPTDPGQLQSAARQMVQERGSVDEKSGTGLPRGEADSVRDVSALGGLPGDYAQSPVDLGLHDHPVLNRLYMEAMNRYANLINNGVARHHALAAVQRIDPDFYIQEAQHAWLYSQLQARSQSQAGRPSTDTDRPDPEPGMPVLVKMGEMVDGLKLAIAAFEATGRREPELLLMGWSAPQPKPPQHVTNVYDQYEWADGDTQALADYLNTLYQERYLETLNDHLTRAGASGVDEITDPEVLANLEQHAQDVAAGVGDTFNNDLANQTYLTWIDQRSELGRQSSQTTLADEIDDWAQARADWKSDDIAMNEAGWADHQAADDFISNNPDAAATGHVEPLDASCADCKDLVDQGTMSAEDLMAIDFPRHPNCDHGPVYDVDSGWGGTADDIWSAQAPDEDPGFDTAAGFGESEGHPFRGNQYASGESGSFAATDLSSATSFIKGHFGAWHEGLSRVQDRALNAYQSPLFTTVNGLMRGQDVKASAADLKEAQATIKNLMSAIDGAPPLEQDVLAHRDFDASYLGKPAQGDQFTEKAFTSTALDPPGQRSGGMASADITVPAGSRVGAGRARELILPPGTTFTVDAVEHSGEHTHYRLTAQVPAKFKGGEGSGHPFRGNQWIQGEGGSQVDASTGAERTPVAGDAPGWPANAAAFNDMVQDPKNPGQTMSGKLITSDTRLLVFHATTPDDAKGLLKYGLDPSAKPMTQARLDYESGNHATFAPGQGVSSGLYVGGHPIAVSGYGRAMVAVNVRAGDLATPPEVGGSDPLRALSHGEGGAVITSTLPPSAFRAFGTDPKHIPALSVDELHAGEGSGHPFHGNQYVQGSQEGAFEGRDSEDKVQHLMDSHAFSRMQAEALVAHPTADRIHHYYHLDPVDQEMEPHHHTRDSQNAGKIPPTTRPMTMVAGHPVIPAMVAAGEGPGHPFRGNQYAAGADGGDEDQGLATADLGARGAGADLARAQVQQRNEENYQAQKARDQINRHFANQVDLQSHLEASHNLEDAGRHADMLSVHARLHQTGAANHHHGLAAAEQSDAAQALLTQAKLDAEGRNREAQAARDRLNRGFTTKGELSEHMSRDHGVDPLHHDPDLQVAHARLHSPAYTEIGAGPDHNHGVAASEIVLLLGDVEGHDFHGNQWTGGQGDVEATGSGWDPKAWADATGAAQADATESEQRDAFYVYDAEDQAGVKLSVDTPKAGIRYADQAAAQKYVDSLLTKYGGGSAQVAVAVKSSADMDFSKGETVPQSQPGTYRLDVSDAYLNQQVLCHEISHIIAMEKSHYLGHGTSFRDTYLSVLKGEMPRLGRTIGKALSEAPATLTAGERVAPVLAAVIRTPDGQALPCFQPPSTMKFGDVAGHDFHGNQWTGGVGGAAIAGLQTKLAAGSLPRARMPVVPESTAGVAAFLSDLQQRGIATHVEQVDPHSLKPTQNEVNPAWVERVLVDLRKNGGDFHALDPHTFVVSKDDYVLDGHHRWAANLLYGSENPGHQVSVLRVDMGIHELLNFTRSFNQRTGHTSNDLAAAEAPDASKPYARVNGKWILLATDTSDGVPLIFGDVIGHDFHGNQWVSGGGGNAPLPEPSGPIAPSTLSAIKARAEAFYQRGGSVVRFSGDQFETSPEYRSLVEKGIRKNAALVDEFTHRDSVTAEEEQAMKGPEFMVGALSPPTMGAHLESTDHVLIALGPRGDPVGALSYEDHSPGANKVNYVGTTSEIRGAGTALEVELARDSPNGVRATYTGPAEDFHRMLGRTLRPGVISEEGGTSTWSREAAAQVAALHIDKVGRLAAAELTFHHHDSDALAETFQKLRDKGKLTFGDVVGHDFHGNQWTGGLGGGGDVTSGRTSLDKATETVNQAIAKLSPEMQARIRMVQDKLRSAPTTQELYYHDAQGRNVNDPNFDKSTAKWDPERQAIHDQIVNDAMARYAEIPTDRQAIIMGGLGGAGKTSLLTAGAPGTPNADTNLIVDADGRHVTGEELLGVQATGVGATREEGARITNYANVNADAIKEELMQRGLEPKIDGLAPMETASLVHEESSDISKELADRLQEEGKNMIYDVTLGSKNSGADKIGGLHDNGYEVKLAFVDVSVEHSLQSALGRYVRGTKDYANGRGQGGRYVLPELIASGRDGESYRSKNAQAFYALISNEDAKLRPDSYVLIDNEGYARRVRLKG